MTAIGSYTTPPVGSGGVVYASGDDFLWEISATTGKINWKTPVSGGQVSAPALSPDRLFVLYGCPHIYGIDRADGEVAWDHSEGCSGGGGTTVAYHEGRVYVPYQGYVMDSATGAIVGNFTSETIPAFGDGVIVYAKDGVLSGVHEETGEQLWTFDVGGGTSSQPLVVNSTVYVASTGGAVHGLDESTGAVRWSGEAGSAVRTYDDPHGHTPPGLGAGHGVLVVPTQTGLTAFASQ